MQYAPYDIAVGWDDEKREAFGDAVINTLAEYAPNIKDIILHLGEKNELYNNKTSVFNRRNEKN